MMVEQVQVRELAGWGLDENKYRPQCDTLIEKIERARHALARSEGALLECALVDSRAASASEALHQQLQRDDLHAEMKGLHWTVGIVDLSRLIAFQRRLIFADQPSPWGELCADDWPALIKLSFGLPVPVAYRLLSSSSTQFLLQSRNPTLHFRTSLASNRFPLQLHGGSPFFEVAEFRGRWFLRDGYHRAYRFLRAGIAHLPAVIIWARTLEELGSLEPWFFSQETLFGPRPPFVTDFLDDDLTIEYHRPRLFKTLRVTIEESVEPALFTSTSGDQE